MPAIRQASVHERGVAFVDDAGKWMASMPADLFGGEGIVAEIEILRGDLTRILYARPRETTPSTSSATRSAAWSRTTMG